MIKGWVHDADAASRILWLYGQAGAGKSAIAQTIAEYCHQTDSLAASFFFFRASPDRNTADRLFPTLAWQLCLSVPGIAPFISAAIESDPLLPMDSIEAQCERLIVEPFEQIAEKYSAMAVPRLIVIIDGVPVSYWMTPLSPIVALTNTSLTNSNAFRWNKVLAYTHGLLREQSIA